MTCPPKPARIRRAAAAVLAATLLPLSLARAQADELATLRSRFDEAVENLQTSRETTLAQRHQTYGEWLGRIEANLREAGDLDGVLKVNQEKARFDRDRALVEDDVVPAPPALRNLQGQFLSSLAQSEFEFHRQVFQLCTSYQAALERLMTNLTTQGRTQEALAVREVRNEVGESMLFRNAELAMLEAQRRTEAATPTATRPEPEQPTGADAIDFSRHPRIHRSGTEPRVTNSRRTAATPTDAGRTVFGRVAVTGLEIITVDETDVSRYRGYWYGGRSEAGYTTTAPRVHIGAGSADGLGPTRVRFDYFSRERGSNRIGHERTEVVEVPPLNLGDRIVVDGEGVRLFARSYRYHGYYSTYRSQSGKDFYGYVVTVTIADGTMLHQSCTVAGLRSTPLP